jgi:hypothetical protein
MKEMVGRIVAPDLFNNQSGRFDNRVEFQVGGWRCVWSIKSSMLQAETDIPGSAHFFCLATLKQPEPISV